MPTILLPDNIGVEINIELYERFIKRNLRLLEKTSYSSQKDDSFKLLYPLIYHNKYLITTALKCMRAKNGFNSASVLARSSLEYSIKMQWAILTDDNLNRLNEGMQFERQKLYEAAKQIGMLKEETLEHQDYSRMPNVRDMLGILYGKSDDNAAYFPYRALSLATHGNELFADYSNDDIKLNFNERRETVIIPLFISLTATISIMDLLLGRKTVYPDSNIQIFKWFNKDNIQPKTIFD